MDLHLSSIQPKKFLDLGKQGALCQGERGKARERKGNGGTGEDAGVVWRERGKTDRMGAREYCINGMDWPKRTWVWEEIFQGSNWSKRDRLNLKRGLLPWK